MKKAIVEICKSKHGKAILLAVNNKRDYKDIALKAKCNYSQSSSLLNKAKTFELIKKEGRIWKKTPEFRHLKIKQVLKEEPIDIPSENKIRIKKIRKKTNTEHVKKDLIRYIQIHFKEISHPYGDDNLELDSKKLKKAADKLIFNLESNGPSRINGLEGRFYESFSAYFSSDRIRKSEFINNFSSLVRCFEPYVKKVVAMKTNNPEEANPSLSKEMISKVITITSNINNNKSNYWKDKPIHEASIRIIFPYRHIEAHEARNYTIHHMEKIIFYLFASIIFINLNY